MQPTHRADVTEIRTELERILRSRAFEKAKRSQRFLRYLVEAAVAEPPLSVNEYAVALDVFDRAENYDPSIDATVRVEAGRLRSRLREYYLDEGRDARVVIEVPKGRYAAAFSPGVIGAASDGGEASAERASGVATEPRTGTDVREGAGEKVSPRLWRPVRMVAMVLVCMGAVLVGLWVLHRRELHAASTLHSMAVLPLRNLSNSPDENYLAEGMTDELNTQLARVPNLRVISHDSVVHEQLDRKSLAQVAKDLDVDTVVEGSILRQGNKIRINVQMTDVRHDRELWASSLGGDEKDLITLQDKVAQEIAMHAGGALPPPSVWQGIAAERPSPEAYDAFLRARYFLDKRDATHSIVYFQRAIDLDANFASAYAGMAEALEAGLTLGTEAPDQVRSKALAAAQKAIALDPRNGAAYTSLGTIEFTQLWDWGRAERDLQRGIQLSPGDSFPVTMYGMYLDSREQPEAALARMRQAETMDPLAFFVSRNVGSSLYFAKRYDEALQQLERAKELQPERADLVDNWMSWTYEMKGMREEAVQHDLASLRQRRPASEIESLERVYSAGGWDAYWRLRLQAVLHEPGSACAPYERGVDYLRLGEAQMAVTSLQEAFDRRCFWIELIGIDPHFDPLRSDPRFAALARRVDAGFASGG